MQAPLLGRAASVLGRLAVLGLLVRLVGIPVLVALVVDAIVVAVLAYQHHAVGVPIDRGGAQRAERHAPSPAG